MSTPRTSYLALGGLVALMAGLFAAVYSLNLRQYRVSLETVDIRTTEHLEKQVERAEAHLLSWEVYLILQQTLERVPSSPVFVYRDERFIPACALPYVVAEVSSEEADAAFRRGVELLPSAGAEQHFRTAALGPVGTPEALYQKISALFNLMEFSQKPAYVCSIITLLNSEKLTPSQIAFFNSLLQEQVEDLSEIRVELAKRQEEALRLNQMERPDTLPFRRMVGSKMWSMREDGLVLLYELDEQITPFVEWSDKPTPHSLEICPGLHAVMGARAIELEKQRIQQQYDRGNVILSISILLAALLVGGIFAVMHRLQKLNAVRTRFIATVSHELRTPLSLIRLHAETLANNRAPSDKVPAYHQTILTEAERLSGIINNVLDFSRMERDQLEVRLEPTDLGALTARVADSFADRFRQEGLTLERALAKNAFGLVDPLAFSQVVYNLLDNALKYSGDAKTIAIGLDVCDGSHILTVADQGIGIPDALKKRVFDEFTRSDAREVTARRGSGIGLNVAKRLVEKMNGTIAVADNEPKGTVFTVTMRNEQRNDHEIIGG